MIEKYALFKVLIYLRNTDAEESIRSLAKKAGVGVATAKRCLDFLLDKRIVKKKVIGKTFQFKLNEDSLVARQLKITMTIAELEDANLADELIKNYPNIESIILFGSSATGKYNSKSDIDLLIISRGKIKIKPLNAEKKLKKELAVICYAHSEWRTKAETDKVFYDKIIADGIPLFGEIPMVK